MRLIQGFVFFLLSALGCATEAPPSLKVSDRIWKGFHADIAKYPYQVAVHIIPTKNGELFHGGKCGGSIISTNFILTAAHCLIPHDATFNPVTTDHLTVYVNRSILYETNHSAAISNVESIFFHPQANTRPRPVGQGDCIDNDMAILKLTKPLTLGPGIQVIPLAKANTTLRKNTAADISGYGDTKWQGQKRRNNQIGQLYGAKVKIADDALCKKCYDDVASLLKNIICAGNVNHASATMFGDSGGPLVVNGVLEGVTACGFSPPNRMNCPDAFARVADSSARAFIKNITGI